MTLLPEAGGQLALDVERARTYACCGRPGPSLSEFGYPDYPHAEDCPNPYIGSWFDRWGRPKRLLWCSDTASNGGACPYNGRPPAMAGDDRCCKAIAAASSSTARTSCTG